MVVAWEMLGAETRLGVSTDGLDVVKGREDGKGRKVREEGTRRVRDRLRELEVKGQVIDWSKDERAMSLQW
jgi:hypothetical protein